jgi:DNA-binding transcriptional LysR family regulator
MGVCLSSNFINPVVFLCFWIDRESVQEPTLSRRSRCGRIPSASHYPVGSQSSIHYLLAVSTPTIGSFDESSCFRERSASSIFPLVASGFGVSIIPKMAAPLASGCCVPLGPATFRKSGYFRNRRGISSKAVKALVAWLRAVVREQSESVGRKTS